LSLSEKEKPKMQNYETRRAYPPALTTEELAEISSSAPDALVRRLLMEIYRLRGVALQAQQLLWTVDNCGRYSPPVDAAIDSLRKRLAKEDVAKVSLVEQAIATQEAFSVLSAGEEVRA
jgi:hypothetical protein